MEKIRLFVLLPVLLQIFLLRRSALAWQIIGTGVNYRAENLTDVNKNNILITYAGYNVKDTETKAWTDRLMEKSLLNQASKYGINHVYAVRGPMEANYASKEIQNSKLIEHIHLQLLNKIEKAKLVVIIAHSSGSFVADEFFGQFYNKISLNPDSPVYAALRQRIVFYNLDGGTRPSRYDDAYINTLFSSINFVWASNLPLTSMNSAVMIAAKSYYSSALNIKNVQVTASKANCLNSKCLHDAVIIESPWDPIAYDTAKDYTLFGVDREVQFDYLLSTQDDLNAMVGGGHNSKSDC